MRALQPYELVVAADSGIETAQRWGITPDLATGDFDSATPEAVTRAEQQGVSFERVSSEKDETDAEIAVRTALERGAKSLTFVASSHGRVDHALAILEGLGAEALADIETDAFVDSTYITVVRPPGTTVGRSNGSTVSLIPLHGNALGVTTTGLKWKLDGATLRAGSAYSVSNEFETDAIAAAISITGGVLLVTQSQVS